jgi:hypothetical protein
MDASLSEFQETFQREREGIQWERLQALFGIGLGPFKAITLEKWLGYWVIASDEAAVRLPGSESLRQAYGQPGTEGPLALGSILYDVLNNIIMDASLEPMEGKSRKLAGTRPEVLAELKAAGQGNCLLVFDRGCASASLVEEMEQSGFMYLMRVGKGFHADCDLAGEGVDETCEVAGHTARIIKFSMPGQASAGVDGAETLITNLMDESLRTKTFKWLFKARWPAGAEFDLVRSNLEIGNFTGQTPNTVNQDFYATLFLRNTFSFYLSRHLGEAGAKRRQAIGQSRKAFHSPEAAALRDRFVGLDLYDDKERRTDELYKLLYIFENDFLPAEYRPLLAAKETRNRRK